MNPTACHSSVAPNSIAFLTTSLPPLLIRTARSHSPRQRASRRIYRLPSTPTPRYPSFPPCHVTACAEAASSSSPSTLLDALQIAGVTLSPHVTASKLDSVSLRGLSVTTADGKDKILKDTQLAVVPADLVLSPSSARNIVRKAFPSSFRATLDELSDAAVMALALLTERSLGAESSLAPLLASLPGIDGMHCAPLWTRDQLDFLKGSAALDAALRVQEGIQKEFDDILSALGSGGDRDDKFDWLTLQGYRWALAIVDSRSTRVSRRDALILAPVSASCRDAPPGVSPSVEAELSGGGMFGGAGARRRLTLRLARIVRPDDESDDAMMTLAVGSDDGGSMEGNVEWLLERGVVFDTAEAAAVDVSFEFTDIDPYFEDKEDIVETAGLETNMSFRLRGADARGKWTPPDNFDAFLRLLCLGGVDSFLLESVFRGQVWGFMELPVSKSNEQAVCDLIIAACEDALDAYGDVVIGDEEGVGSNDTTALRRRLARTIVSAEKQTLETVKAHYEKTEQSLDVLEYYAERRLNELDLLRPLDDSEIVDAESGSRMGRAFDENYR